MSIRLQLLLGFAVVVLLAGFQGFLTLRSVEEVGSLATRMYDEPLTAISYTRSAQTNFSETVLHMTRAVRLSQNFGSEEDIAEVEGSFENFRTDLEVAIERFSEPETRDRAASIQTAADAWMAQGRTLLVGSEGGAPITEVPAWIVLESEAERIADDLGILVEEAAANGYVFRAQAEEVGS